MKLVVKCSVCDVELVQVTKETISDEDTQMYQTCAKCKDHPDNEVTTELTSE